MKKIALLLLLLAGGVIAYFVYVDNNPPTVDWGVANNALINRPLTIGISDAGGIKSVCYTLSGGECPGQRTCVQDLPAQATAYELSIEPKQCAPGPEPFAVKIDLQVEDTSIITNQADAVIELTYDDQPPHLTALQGTRSLKRGGSGVVQYEVGETPAKIGIQLEELRFRAFEVEPGRYLSFYAHPYYVEPDAFKPRIFAVDQAGNRIKIRPGSVTAEHAYGSEEIILTDDFMEQVKEKMQPAASGTPLEAFIAVNDELRQESNQKLIEICARSHPGTLWEGAFLRNLGATKANFADSRTYTYQSDIVSQQVHTGIDIAGLNNTPIVAANHGEVVFTGEVGIYGRVVVIDHGYGLHSIYGHLDQIKAATGDRVNKGDLIGISGETGLAFGDHLHYEMRVDGVPVNPIEWFDQAWVKSHIEPFLPATGKSGSRGMSAKDAGAG